MRTNKFANSAKSIATHGKTTAWIKFVALAVCFVTIFAVTLTLALSSAANGVALGATRGTTKYSEGQDEKDAERTIGTSGDLIGDKGGDDGLGAEDFGFPGREAAKTSWSVDETFDNFSPSHTNYQAYKNTGKSDLYMMEGGKNYWEFGIWSRSKAHTIGISINYPLSDFLKRIVKNPGITVKASYSATGRSSDFGNNVGGKGSTYYCLVASSTAMEPKNLLNNSTNGGTTDNNKNDLISWTVSGNVTLTSTTQYLCLGFGGSFANQTFGDRKSYLELYDLKMTFTITMNSGENLGTTFGENTTYDDGAAPVIAQEVKYGTYDDVIAPYRTDAASLGSGNNAWRMWYPELQSNYARKLDSYSYPTGTTGSGRVTMQSYQGTPLGSSPVTYYKHVKLTVVDTYNYYNFGDFTDDAMAAAGTSFYNYMGAYNKFLGTTGSTAKTVSWAGGTADTRFASGIKTVKVGDDTTINVYSATLTGSFTGGSVVVSKSSRGLVGIDLYFTTNTDVAMTVTDYGGYSLTINYTVKGIDTQNTAFGQTSPNNDNNYFAATKESAANTNWLHESTIANPMDFDQTEFDSDSNYSPYVWFATVNKYDDLASAKLEALKSNDTWETFLEAHADIQPIAVETITELGYNFVTGNLTGVGNKQIPGNDKEISTRTGVGYYVFSIYTFDAAGNKPNSTSSSNNYGVLNYIVKVDYDQPIYTAEITFDGGKITAENNGAWVTGGNAKLVIALEEANTSGNTLAFSISDGDSYYVVAEGGKIVDFSGTTGELADGAVTITRRTELEDVTLRITFEDGKFIFAINDDKDAAHNQFYTLMWQATYTTYIGAYKSATGQPIGELIEADTSAVPYVAEEWTGGICVYVDRNAPETPEIALGEGHTATENYLDEVPYERNWYTAGTRLNGNSINLEDAIFATALSDQIKVFLGIKVLTSESAFNDFVALEPLEHLREIGANIAGQIYYDNVVTYNEFEITGSNGYINDLTIDLLNSATLSAGLRIFTFWTEDQAGNVSVPTSYAMFVDSTNYNFIVATDTSNSVVLPADSASLVIEGGAKSASQVKRGTTFNLVADFADYFMPHKLTLGDKTLLENYMPTLLDDTTVQWKLVDESYAEYLTGFDSTPDDQGLIGNMFSFVFDDPTNYGPMGATQTMTLLHRRVVSPNVESKVTYNSQPVQPYATLNGTWNEEQLADVKEHITIIFRDSEGRILYADKNNDDPKRGFTVEEGNAKTNEDGSYVYFTPVLPGVYTFEMFILKDDALYVMTNFAMNEEGEQQFPEEERKSIEIVKGTAYIVPVAGSADYGMKFSIQYRVTTDEAGLDVIDPAVLESEGGLHGALALSWQNNTYRPASGVGDFAEKLAAASYAIIEGETFSIGEGETYTVNFKSGVLFAINPRLVNIEAIAATKIFGDQDPAFKFRVALAQFVDENSIDLPEAILTEIFGSFYEPEMGDDYYTYVATTVAGGNAILREEGEHAQAYNFLNDTTQLQFNRNYTLRLQTNEQFTITQRTVKVRVDDSATILYGSEFHPESAEFGYLISNVVDSAIDSVRTAVQDIMAALKMTLQAEYTTLDGLHPGYEEIRLYQIVLEGTTFTADVQVELDAEDNGDKYLVYVGDATATIISLKSGERYSFIYGQFTWQADSVTYSAEKFEVTNVPEGKSVSNVTWDAQISGGHEVGTMLLAGNYIVTLTNVKLFDQDGEQMTECIAIVPNVQLTVSTAQIVVAPTYTKLNKVYGDEDSVFGLGFDIVSIGGLPVDKEGGYAGKSYEELLALVKNGSFARAIYAEGGAFRSYGTQFDGATDENGVKLDGSGDYYRVRTLGSFASSDINFSVADQIDENLRFVVEQYQIDIDIANFIGLSKAYDGTDIVPYIGNKSVEGAGRIEAYKLADYALNGDSISLAFYAKYSSMGAAGETHNVSIKFENFSIEGEDAFNYKLGKIKNSVEDGKNKIYNNDEEASGEIDIAEGVSVEIFYIDNTITSEINNLIQIYAGVIGVHKTDVTVSKVYDNTRALTIDAIGISERTDEADGASPGSLRSALLIGNAKIMPETTPYSSQNVGSNYVVNVKVFFQIAGNPEAFLIANNMTEQEEYAGYDEADVSVTVGSYEDVSGIIVTVNNIRAAITQRVIDGNSFTMLDAIDRDYNSTENVEISYKYVDGALAAGDSATSVGLTLTGVSKDGAGAGTHSVTIAESSSVRDANYKLDVEAINTAFSGASDIDVVISKAKLRPNVVFIDRAYNGEYNLTQVVEGVGDYTLGEGYEETPLTTLSDAALLASELKTFHITEVTYQLSKNGAVDPGVNFDPETNAIIKHNVLVKGLTITADTPDMLSNYELYGWRYTTSGYSAVGNITSGEAIADYELLEEILITRADLMVQDQNVHIANKVYDGTREATVSIDLPDQMPQYDKYFLAITATGNYTKFNVGDNITVTLSSPVLHFVSPDQDAFNELLGGIDDDVLKEYLTRVNTTLLDSLISNYQLVASTRRFSGSIIARPVTVDVLLGEKTYDGTPNVATRSISFGNFQGMIADESKYYKIQVEGGAYYDDKNVVPEDVNGGVKYGTAFNPALRNTKGIASNYVLSFAKTYKTLAEYNKDSEYELLAIEFEGETFFYDDAASFVAAHTFVDTESFVDDGNNVDITTAKFYYALLVATKYVEVKTDADYVETLAAALNDAIEKEGFIGCITDEKGVNYYAVTDKWVTEHSAEFEGIIITDALGERPYIRAQGKINPKSIYIGNDAIRAIEHEDRNVFEKEYDGTTKFFGKQGANAEDSEGDFYYTEGSIQGLVAGDEVHVADFTAEFDNANTTAVSVVFYVNKLEGKDLNNYVMSQATYTTRLPAAIVKREIVATLADAEMSYGTAVNSVGGEITYTMGGKALTFADNAFYMLFAEYLEIVGITKEDDEAFYEQLKVGTYNFTDDRFVQIDPAGEAGEYIRLGGDFVSMPSPRAEFMNSINIQKPNAGDIASGYYLTGGEATNFAYSYAYSSEDTALLTVTPKHVYVSATNIDYFVEYGNLTAIPSGYAHIAFYDEFGNAYTFASGDSYQSIFAHNNVDYGPVMSWYEYSWATGEAVYIPNNKLDLSEALAAKGACYVAQFGAPSGVDYNAYITNYKFHFGKITHDESTGDIVYKINFFVNDSEEEGLLFAAQTSVLTVVKPTLTGITVNQLEYSFPYDGSNKLPGVVTGNYADDAVSMIGASGTGEVINVGTYTGNIQVVRTVRWDGDDEGETIMWTSDEVVTITITPIDPQMSAKDDAKIYDGKTYTYLYYNDNGTSLVSSGMNVSVGPGQADLSYEKLVNGVYYAAYAVADDGTIIPLLAEIDAETGATKYYYTDVYGTRHYHDGEVKPYTLVDAGMYRISIKLNSSWAASNKNFTPTTFTAFLNISAAEVVVSDIALGNNKAKQQDDGRFFITEKFDAQKDYAITYNIAMPNLANMDENCVVDFAKTHVVWANEIKAAGRYTFRIELNADLNASNYTFVSANGVLELTQSSFTFDNTASSPSGGTQGDGQQQSGETLRVVDESGEETSGVVANRFEVRRLKQTGGTAADTELWTAVEAYMPSIAQNAQLAGIVQVQLYCDNTRVSVTGTPIELTIKVPDGIDQSLKDIVIYVKNANGGLTKLTDYKLTPDGYIVYTTDYLGEIVFVNLNAYNFPVWAYYVAIGVGAAVALFVLWVLIAYIARKVKLKKLV